MRQPQGLKLCMLDVNKFVTANLLRETSNPIFLDKNTFTPDGILSNEIFGTSAYERRNRFAYIDLKDHYMQPLAAVKLASYDRKLADALYARGRYKISSAGQMVEDPDGGSGPEWVYQNWGKVKVAGKTTETTKEIQRFFEKPRDELFITKFPVIPAFYRDINLSETSASKSSSILNSKYSSIISYTQSLSSYATGFANMTRLTQARVQTLIVDIYNELMIHTVKGSPSKFGMLRRDLAGKNLPYTARLVITAANLQQESVESVPVKFGYVTVPLAYVCALFMPFMVHELKAYFDAQFIQGGKIEYRNEKGVARYMTFAESYDENAITGMINKFVNSPNTRFDPVPTPPDVDGVRHQMMITGRFNKENTTFSRPATYTDIMYIVAERVCRNKHVFVTRYPMDNPQGQWPGRILVSSTTKTKPVTIGDTVYEFYPVIEGDPLNAFMNTAQISNTMIGPMGADFDGDQISVKGCWTKESNADAERLINSKYYILNQAGKTVRPIEKDFLLTQYMLTYVKDPSLLTKDCNRVKPKYVI